MSGSIASIALDFVDEVMSARNDSTVRELLLDHARKLGFDHLIVCDQPLPGQTFEVQLCSWPPALLARYCEVLHVHDPIARHAARSTEPFVWSEVHWDRSSGSREQRVMDEAAEFGLEDGFVVPVVGVSGEQSCLGLAGQRMTLQDSDRRALHLMCLYAHHMVRRRRHTSQSTRGDLTRLTKVQCDCLAYAFMGADANAIAERICLSSQEVRRVCREAARALRIAQPAEAAVRAMVLGEIRP